VPCQSIPSLGQKTRNKRGEENIERRKLKKEKEKANKPKRSKQVNIYTL